MDDNLVRFNINAKNMTRIFWVLFVGPAVFYVVVNIINLGFGEFWNNFMGIRIIIFLPVLLLTYVIHEGLHVLGGMFAGVKFDRFNFGFDKKTLSIECGCQEEMSIHGYLLFLLIPFVVLTPLITGLAFFADAHHWWLLLVMSTSGCAFDLTIFMGLLGIPGDTRIIPVLEGENGYVYVKAAS